MKAIKLVILSRGIIGFSFWQEKSKIHKLSKTFQNYSFFTYLQGLKNGSFFPQNFKDLQWLIESCLLTEAATRLQVSTLKGWAGYVQTNSVVASLQDSWASVSTATHQIPVKFMVKNAWNFQMISTSEISGWLWQPESLTVIDVTVWILGLSN